MRRIPPDGTGRERIVVIGEAPATHEVAQGRPFVGPSGQAWARWLRGAGLQRSDCYIDNVYQYQAPKNKIDCVPKDELRPWMDNLHDRIASLEDPWIIVPMGNTALRALGLGASITKLRGSILEYIDKNGRVLKVIPTLHPAATFRTPMWERRCRLDWMRIAGDVEFRERRVPEREHIIKPTLADLEWFVADCRERAELIALDIETPREAVLQFTKKGKPKKVPKKGEARITCVGVSFEPHWSMTIPTTLSYWQDEADLERAWALIRELAMLPQPKVLQNGLFDTWWLGRPEYAVPVRNYAWDTRWMHALEVPGDEHSLAYQASIDTREPYWKDDAKDEAGEFKAELIDEGGIETFWRYCGKDAATTLELGRLRIERLNDRHLLTTYREHYASLFPAMLRLMHHGVRVDTRARRIRRTKLLAQSIVAQEALTALAGEPLYGKKGDFSGPKLTKFLYETLRLPRQLDRKTGKATAKEVVVRKLMLRFPAKLAEAGAHILTHRRTFKMTSFLDDKIADADGRVRSQYGFTKTLRFTASKNPKRTGQNLQNVDRELRDGYVADDGMFMLEADLSQAESRVVYCLTGDPDLVTIARSKPWEFDDHKRTASVIFNLPTDTEWNGIRFCNATTKSQRYFGKHTRHAAHYGEGGGMMSDNLLKEGEVRTPDECTAWLETLFSRKPDAAIRDWQATVRKKAMRDKAIANSWGLIYDVEFERLSDQLYRELYAWQPQSEVGILLNQWGFKPLDAMIVKSKLKTRINLQTHDALTVSTTLDEAYDIATFLKDSLERPRSYGGVSCVIPIEVKVGWSWAGGLEFKQLPARDEFTARVREHLERG